jgi:hypothetical protein
MRQRALLVSAALIAALSLKVDANALFHMSDAEMMRASDLVAYGKVERFIRRRDRDYAVVRLERLVKGAAGREIEFLTNPGIEESNPRCCELGAHYLFYLERIPVGGYDSVDGHFGVIRSDKQAARY